MKTQVRKVGLVLSPVALAALILAAFFLATAVSSTEPVHADAPVVGDWIITVMLTDTGIHVVDTADDTVYGPFLVGQLGSAGGGRLDVAVTPDGNTALVSNFGDREVHFVDVSDPISPSWVSSVTLPIFAEDIAITHDGRFALVTDGMFSSLVASISVVSRTLVYTLDLGIERAQAVDIAPNGTVILADYSAGEVHALTIDDSGDLITPTSSYTPTDAGPPSPINVAVAPDGETVIVCHVFSDSVGIYQVTGPGKLAYRRLVTGVTTGTQSVAFNAAGDKAYVVANGVYTPARISVLDIKGPGDVSLHAAEVASLFSEGTSQLFGVDVIAVVGGKAYVGNPTLPGATPYLAVVELADYGVTGLLLGDEWPDEWEDVPIGVAVIPRQRKPVGGVVLPSKEFALLEPYMGIAALALVGAAAVLWKLRMRFP
jgi:DNA-binding beta-propeller fold protein YncE